MTPGRLAHAIARARGLDAPGPAGGLARLEVGALAILHGPAPPEPGPPDPARDLGRLRAYAEAVNRAHRAEPILPLRYGCVGSEGELGELLRRDPGPWIAALDEVEGADEMGLRVLLGAPDPGAAPTPPPPPPGPAGGDRPGTAYLRAARARREGLGASEGVVDRGVEVVLGALGGLCRRSTVERPGPGRERLLSFCFLVPRDRLDAFRAAAKGLEGRAPGPLLVSGPWPPYHFAGPGPRA